MMHERKIELPPQRKDQLTKKKKEQKRKKKRNLLSDLHAEKAGNKSG